MRTADEGNTPGRRAAKQPLLVHLVYHPRSSGAADLARLVQRRLNGDVMVPGLRIPTVFCATGEDGSPPAELRLDRAEWNVVVPLADDQLCVDPDWCRFVADIFEIGRQPRMRYVPVQLSSAAWPLDDRLKGVSFARAYLEAEGSDREEFVLRRLVVELCRYISGLDFQGDRTEAPVKLFLSHAKSDLTAAPNVTRKLIECLREDQPIEAWVDSGDIATGSEFSKAIEEGVKHTSLLVVLTDSYAAREWCREEILLAKEHQRPIAVIDALTRYEVRAFPYLGNVPRIRWDENPQAGIDLLLKETLRHLHTKVVLGPSMQPGDMLFTRPPELATLIGLDPKTSILYPDPPIGLGEARRIAKTNVHFATPLERLAADQSLKGKVIALSMSESTDIERAGLNGIHLESAMLDLSRYLLIKGATLAYGGHLGAEGYTQKLFELVRMHNGLEGCQPFDRIVNHRAWPLPRLRVDQLAEQNRVCVAKELPRPPTIDETLGEDFKAAPAFFPAEKSAAHRFAWAQGMTGMRVFQSDKARSGIVARIVIGGTFGPTVKVGENGVREERWYAGRIPGVLEEVLLSAQAGQPVFLIGAFGGVARLVIDLLQGRDRPEATWDYQKRAPFAPEMRTLYEQRGLAWMDYPEITDLLRHKGLTGINPILSEDEQVELFDTIDPFRMVELVLLGLSRL